MKRKADLMDCPGAWYGTEPKTELGGFGHVVVDPAQTVQAIQWLSRRYHILTTTTKLTTDNGLFIRVQTR